LRRGKRERKYEEAQQDCNAYLGGLHLTGSIGSPGFLDTWA
jgi:hypothetical protein